VKGWRGLGQLWVRPAVVAALGIAAFAQLTGIKRDLSLWMLPGAALALAAGVFLFDFANKQNAWMVISCLLVYMFFNAGGIQVVGWLSGSEMYPLSIRGAGTSAQAAVVWGADLLVTVQELSLIHWLTERGTMLVYVAMNVLAWIFTYRRVPETAGKSLEDIEQMLQRGEFHP
jgi:hypothetical protein